MVCNNARESLVGRAKTKERRGQSLKIGCCCWCDNTGRAQMSLESLNEVFHVIQTWATFYVMGHCSLASYCQSLLVVQKALIIDRTKVLRSKVTDRTNFQRAMKKCKSWSRPDGGEFCYSYYLFIHRKPSCWLTTTILKYLCWCG